MNPSNIVDWAGAIMVATLTAVFVIIAIGGVGALIVGSWKAWRE